MLSDPVRPPARRRPPAHVLRRARGAHVADRAAAAGARRGPVVRSRGGSVAPGRLPGDREASAEFRRWTEPDLVAQKTANASTVHAWAAGARDGAFDAEDEQAWLRCLTDLRLTIADRLGIVDATTEERSYAADAGVGLRDVYDWLGAVQEHLVETLLSAR
ncbi:DUF2017 family protein [Curtobacterium flaccumfaciens]|nr:DUF2017 family protein [Curtobacterium flaccumfaciens]